MQRLSRMSRAVSWSVVVSLKVTTNGTFDVHSHGISFNLHDGTTTMVPCTVAGQVLLDLADHHFMSFSSKEQAFSLLIPEIERLASAKYEAGRLEDNGELLIGTADLLRFGFQARSKSAV
jgi:hypothetical protein